MKRGSVSALSSKVWRSIDGLDLEVCLVPSGMPNLTTSAFGLSMDEIDRRVCQRAFVDFKNYTEDDGKPIPNTLEARLELYQGAPAIRQRIDSLLGELNTAIFEGEESAASA